MSQSAERHAPSMEETLAALQDFSRLFPRSMRASKGEKNLIGFLPQTVRAVERARRVIRGHGLRPAHIPEEGVR